MSSHNKKWHVITKVACYVTTIKKFVITMTIMCHITNNKSGVFFLITSCRISKRALSNVSWHKCHGMTHVTCHINDTNDMIQQSFMDSSTSGSASSSEAMLASTAVVTDRSSSDPELLPLLVKDRVSIAFPAALAFELWLSSVEASLEL